jgi:hypothetical protein
MSGDARHEAHDGSLTGRLPDEKADLLLHTSLVIAVAEVGEEE